MEQYTDRNHADYIPGTYSIYSSAVLRQMERQRRRQQRAANGGTANSSLYSSKISSSDDGMALGQGGGTEYNYKYDRKTPLELIPELKTRYGVILLPQPTNSPNDPLNWSTKRKALHFLILMFITGFTAAITNDASTPQDSINELTGISYETLNNTAGVLFISIGLSTWLMSPLEPLCGRRITYIICLLFAVAGCVWYGAMKRSGDAFGSQVFIGFSEGCSEAQVQLSLASIFFRHQLGAVITIYVLSFCLGTYLGPLFANFICNENNPNDTFRWVGWEGAIISAATLLVVVFLLEEDSFDYSRFSDHYENPAFTTSLAQHGIVSTDNDDALGYYDQPYAVSKRLQLVTLPRQRTSTQEPENHGLQWFFKNYTRLLIRNLKCIWFPPVLFTGLIWGIQDAILTFYLTTEDTALYDPPFNFSTNKVAIMEVPCIIGSIIGCLYSGSLTDYFILWLARKRGGTVESEYRLFFAFFSGIIGSVGLLMFGFGISRDLDWRVFYVGLGFISYTFSSALNISLLYVIDTYDQLILETLVAVALINNGIGCIFTFACSPWLENSGIENTYIALAVIQFVLMMLSLPYIIWGKGWRRMTKKTYLSMINERTV